MKAQTFHFELNPIVQDIIDVLDEGSSIKGSIQLEIKYAFLKKCTSQAQYKSLVASSHSKPIIITRRKDSKNYRINAKSEQWQFDNACERLKQIEKKSNSKSEQSYQFCLNISEVRLIYDCSLQKWKNYNKRQLFERQQNVLSKNTLFRIDMSQKQEEGVDLDRINTVLNKERDELNVMRFKHIFQHRIHKYYTIFCQIVYETEDQNQFERMRSIIMEKENIAEEIKATMKVEEKKDKNIKYEMELRFTHQGVKFMKDCDEIDLQVLFSKAFDFFRDLSMKAEISEEQLSTMMNGLNLGEQKKEQKQQKSLKREDCRQFISSIKGNKKMQQL